MDCRSKCLSKTLLTKSTESTSGWLGGNTESSVSSSLFLQGICFEGSKLYHRVKISLEKGRSARLIWVPACVKGKEKKKTKRENEMFPSIFASSNIMKIIGQACFRGTKRCHAHDTKHWWISFLKPGDVLYFQVWKKCSWLLNTMRVRGADSISHSAVENPCLTLQLAPVFKVPQPQIQPATDYVMLWHEFSRKKKNLCVRGPWKNPRVDFLIGITADPWTTCSSAGDRMASWTPGHTSTHLYLNTLCSSAVM